MTYVLWESIGEHEYFCQTTRRRLEGGSLLDDGAQGEAEQHIEELNKERKS